MCPEFSIWTFFWHIMQEPLLPVHFSSTKGRQPASHSIGYPRYLSASAETSWASSCHSLLFPFLVLCTLGKVNVATLAGARQRVFPFWEHSPVHCFCKEPYLFLSCFLLGFHLCSLLWFNSSNSGGLILARKI